MKNKIIIILLLNILFFSCKTDIKQEKIVLIPNDFTNIKIELQDGKKWPVDKPMMAHIQNIKKDVVQFKGTSLEDYNKLSYKINKHLDLLTSNCTMTGKGHDELHKWLLPFLDISKKFANSKSLQEAKDNYQVIKHSFNLVDVNFK